MRSHSSFRSILAALSLSLLTGPAPAVAAGRLSAPFATPQLPRRRPERKPDPDRQFAAAVKREKKNWKRLWARSQGGWVSSDAWQARLVLRRSMAAAEAELAERLS